MLHPSAEDRKMAVTASELEEVVGLPPGYLDEECTEEAILKIYQDIAYTRPLAHQLGLRGAKITWVEGDAKSEEERSFLLLQRWKQMFSFKAKYRVLVEALIAIQCTQVARDVCEHLLDFCPGYKRPPSDPPRPPKAIVSNRGQQTTTYPLQEIGQKPTAKVGKKQTEPINTDSEVHPVQETGDPQEQPQPQRERGSHQLQRPQRGSRVEVDDDDSAAGDPSEDQQGGEDQQAGQDEKADPQAQSDGPFSSFFGGKKKNKEDAIPTASSTATSGANLPVGHGEGEEDEDDRPYGMTSMPRGLGIVINNKNFDPRSQLKSRAGTNVDAGKLVNLFQWLGFETRRCDDQTAEQMKTELKRMAEDCNKPGMNYDCVIVAILTHGSDNGVLWGTDGQEVLVKSITRFFDGQYCEALKDKPKVFILQACRGGKKDVVHDFPAADSAQPDSFLPDGEDAQTLESDYRKQLPREDGFILSFSTTPGYLSWRDTYDGSWFINAFVNRMVKSASKKHLLDILTAVNRDLSQSEDYKNGKYKQMPSFESRLTRDLYFKPPPTAGQ